MFLHFLNLNIYSTIYSFNSFNFISILSIINNNLKKSVFVIVQMKNSFLFIFIYYLQYIYIYIYVYIYIYIQFSAILLI